MRTLQNLSEPERRLVSDLRQGLMRELPDIGLRLVVFGSRARGDAEPDSDMDVLVAVDLPHLSFADKQRLRRVATELSIASGIVVTLLVVDGDVLAERGDYSVFANVRDEGIAV